MMKFFKKRFTKVSLVASALMLTVVSSAFASPTVDTDTVSSITSAFGDLKSTALAALGALASIAIILFAAIYAWSYAKKVFKIIAK